MSGVVNLSHKWGQNLDQKNFWGPNLFIKKPFGGHNFAISA
jgi:hypothetical protein